MPRWLHRLYSELLGYFWLPCPLCGEMFGGHERFHHYYCPSCNSMLACCKGCRRRSIQLNEYHFAQGLLWKATDQQGRNPIYGVK